VVLVYQGLGVIRIPVSPLPPDAYRYKREIEGQFEGQGEDRVLLDFGTWVYVPAGVVMKDRASTVATRGNTEVGDYSGMIRRLRQKQYSKVLVRRLHRWDFWYDFQTWRHPSGIKEALLENYYESGVIGGVPGEKSYGLSEVSILLPRP
jgi:hypothetical protein